VIGPTVLSGCSAYFTFIAFVALVTRNLNNMAGIRPVRTALACLGVYSGTLGGSARNITTDTGWKIVLDRGLDIFQVPLRKDGFSLGDRLQELRAIKGLYVTHDRFIQQEIQVK